MAEERRNQPRLREVPIVSQTILGLWKLAESAFTSGISSLLNKAAFTEFEQLGLQGDKKTQPLIVVFTDLSGFKAVNDEHGHTVGDLLLTEVGRRLGDFCGSHGGTAFHLSGDEFAMLFGVEEWEVAREQLGEVHEVELEFKSGDALKTLRTSLFFGFTLTDPIQRLGKFLDRAEVAAMRAKSVDGSHLLEWDEAFAQEPLVDQRKRCGQCGATTRLQVPKSKLVERAPTTCANCGELFDPKGT